MQLVINVKSHRTDKKPAVNMGFGYMAAYEYVLDLISLLGDMSS
jgi:hypothetical protein